MVRFRETECTANQVFSNAGKAPACVVVIRLPAFAKPVNRVRCILDAMGNRPPVAIGRDAAFMIAKETGEAVSGIENFHHIPLPLAGIVAPSIPLLGICW